MLSKERCMLAFEDIKKYGENNIPPLAIDIFKRLIDEHFTTLENKKIIYKKGNDGNRWFFCPTCNKSIPKTSNCIDQYKYPYCPYCGEKLDWSEYFSD